MQKLGLIIEREYMTRVRRRKFWLTTLLAPLGFILFVVIVGVIMSAGVEEKRIALVDESDLLALAEKELPPPQPNTTVRLVHVRDSLEAVKAQVQEGEYAGILYIPSRSKPLEMLPNIEFFYYSDAELGLSTRGTLTSALEGYIRDLKVERLNIDPKLLAQLDIPITLKTQALQPNTPNKDGSIYLATFLGGAMGFLIYLVIIMYGSMVMRAVFEEKRNRIVEIVISSARPFELMLGKIVGVGAVGLTQFGIWLILIPLTFLVFGIVVGGDLTEAQQLAASNPQVDNEQVQAMAQVLQDLSTLNYPKIFITFILFFLAGYLLYASLFAAVGSAMGDDLTEGQMLTVPITVPIMIAIYIAIAVVDNPSSSLATWSSWFPLFSPIIMPTRLAFDPPWWEIMLSFSLLLATCVLFIWLGGRIYRVGILLYGKKVSLRELVRWIFAKD